MSAVRFERVNDDAELETKEVARIVPKITRRKWNSDEEDSDKADYGDDEYLYQKTPLNGLSDSIVISEHHESDKL